VTRARFVSTYRVANDHRLLDLFGPAGSARRRANRYVVVASQVVVTSRPLIRTPLQQIAFMVGVGLVVVRPMSWLFGTPYWKAVVCCQGYPALLLYRWFRLGTGR